jgi:hypothetical protein
MILRIFALYAQNKWVLVGLGIVWLAQIIISSVGITLGFCKSSDFILEAHPSSCDPSFAAAPLPPGYTGESRGRFDTCRFSCLILSRVYLHIQSQILPYVSLVLFQRHGADENLSTAALWVAPLITDSIIFLMTLLRTNDYKALMKGTPYVHHWLLFSVNVRRSDCLIHAEPCTSSFVMALLTSSLSSSPT